MRLWVRRLFPVWGFEMPPRVHGVLILRRGARWVKVREERLGDGVELERRHGKLLVGAVARPILHGSYFFLGQFHI
ncbi:hypothetical protein NLG97_g2157 [Lecanicillium saksenae]|uniref:Uncharacterized protein n=1 Tax=Lecanicillium saksenae TaxID=468837 RepID=A0ACC1R1X4_9HYPO|nr:hypothetical protein NLG97_g2157 [Lecanicillium saksenae]